jgi:two-component system sensor histidine kinase BaeS
MSSSSRGSRLVVRLAVAFALVALGAVVLLAALTVVATRSEVSKLARTERADLAQKVAGALASEYAAAGGWDSADTRRALAIGEVNGAVVTVLDDSGAVVAGSSGAPGPVGPAAGSGGVGTPGRGSPVSAAVESGGERVGSVVLRFPGAGLSAAESSTRSSLTTIVLAGALLSVLLAIGAAIVLSRRITRPIHALSAAAASLERGDLGARAAIGDAPGEIGELGRAFDSMAETIQRESALRRALVADVAHELRTPVTILQASCEALVDGVVSPSPEQLGSLHDEVLRLGRLVGDLETLTSAEAARLDLRPALVDLATVAALSAERLRPYFDAAELTLEQRLAPVEIVGDAARLGQVVDNLLGNALKFTPPGGLVTLDVREGEGEALLVVTDTGPGIPAIELPHVFERFWRGENAHGVSGSGVGLAIVAELVEAHRGHVSVATDPGKGSVFTVGLPLARA